VDLTNIIKCIEIYQRKRLLSPNSLVKPNSIRAEWLLSTPAAAFRSKGNPQQASHMIIDRRRFHTKSSAIAVVLAIAFH
jgi:hypothetical protein